MEDKINSRFLLKWTEVTRTFLVVHFFAFL